METANHLKPIAMIALRIVFALAAIWALMISYLNLVSEDIRGGFVNSNGGVTPGIDYGVGAAAPYFIAACVFTALSVATLRNGPARRAEQMVT